MVFLASEWVGVFSKIYPELFPASPGAQLQEITSYRQHYLLFGSNRVIAIIPDQCGNSSFPLSPIGSKKELHDSIKMFFREHRSYRLEEEKSFAFCKMGIGQKQLYLVRLEPKLVHSKVKSKVHPTSAAIGPKRIVPDFGRIKPRYTRVCLLCWTFNCFKNFVVF